MSEDKILNAKNNNFNVKAFTQNKNNKIIISGPHEMEDENSQELSPIRKQPVANFETITQPSNISAFNTVRMGNDPTTARALFQTRRESQKTTKHADHEKKSILFK